MLLVLAGHAWGQGNKPRILFLINEKAVYTDEFIYLYKKNHLKPEDFTDQKINEYLDLFTNFKLKVMEAKARGLDTTEAFRKEFRTYREELKKPYVAEKDELDRLTKEAYQRLKEEVKASHILIRPVGQTADEALAKAKALRARILAGESFAAIAESSSDDPTAKQNKGDLGYFGPGQMDPAFEAAAFAMGIKGEISDPVRTRFGYHLIRLDERKPPRQRSFEEVAPELMENLKSQFLDARRALVTNKLFDPSRVEWNEPAVGQLKKTVDPALLKSATQ